MSNVQKQFNDQITFEDLEDTNDNNTVRPTLGVNAVESFIPKAFDALLDRKGYRGNLANYIASKLNGNDIAIDEAIAFAAIECQAQGTEAPFNVMACVSFYQDLMDKGCWNARKLYVANNIAEEQERGSGGIYGIDLADRAIEATGVNALNDVVPEIVKSDYEHLFIGQSEVLSVLGIDADIDLYFFNPSQYDKLTDTWQTPHRCESFSSALEAMEGICDELKINERETKLAEYKRLRDARLKQRLAA